MTACLTNSNSRRHCISSQISKIHLPKQDSLKLYITMLKNNAEHRMHQIMYQFQRENISTPFPPPRLLTTPQGMSNLKCQVSQLTQTITSPSPNYEFEIKFLTPINSSPLQQEGESKYSNEISKLARSSCKSDFLRIRR